MHLKLTYIKLITFFVATAFFAQANAQDIDRKKVDIVYIRLPLNALPTDVSTYYINVKSKNTSWGNTLGNVYDADMIKLNGYYRLPDASDADLVIESEVVNDLIYDKADERKAELTYKKDKNSPEIKYIAYYYYITYYTPKLRYKLSTRSGKVITEAYVGGVLTGMEYGSTNYSNYHSNSYSLSNAWRNDKNGIMAGNERDAFQVGMNSLRGTCLSYCMYPAAADYSVRYVDEKKGRTVYADLLQARDYYLEAVSLFKTDRIGMINKLVQPDYETRKETMKKAIDIWEKALAEADFENKKARIDSKVGRHLYYNLALAYLWIDDFVKAKEYAQGRKKDLGSWDKNLLSGIRDLSALIDDRAARQEANKWRQVIVMDSNVYVYKDPATRQRESEEAQKAMIAKLKAEKADSLARAKKTKSAVTKGKVGVKSGTGKASSSVKPPNGEAVNPKSSALKTSTKS